MHAIPAGPRGTQSVHHHENQRDHGSPKGAPWLCSDVRAFYFQADVEVQIACNPDIMTLSCALTLACRVSQTRA